jgi:hypothetical protein
MGRHRITPADEARTVDALRVMVRTPDLAIIWDTWTPRQRMMWAIGYLLNLPACCPAHRRVSRQFMRGFLPEDISDDRHAIRRRALEILAAVALVDGTPETAPIAPITHLAN